MFGAYGFINPFEQSLLGLNPFALGAGIGGVSPWSAQLGASPWSGTQATGPISPLMQPQGFGQIPTSQPQVGFGQIPGVQPQFGFGQIPGMQPHLGFGQIPSMQPQPAAPHFGFGQVPSPQPQVGFGQVPTPHPFAGIQGAYAGRDPRIEYLTQLNPLLVDPILKEILARQAYGIAPQQVPVKPLLGANPYSPYQTPESSQPVAGQWADPYAVAARLQVLSELAQNPLVQMHKAYRFGSPFISQPFSAAQFGSPFGV